MDMDGHATAETAAQELGGLLSSFSAGCDHCDNRDLWLLVRTRNDGGKTRGRLRGEGIKHLADVLEDADFAAVEALVKPLVSSRKNPVNLAKVLPDITVPTDVRVYKADDTQVYGDEAKYHRRCLLFLLLLLPLPPLLRGRAGLLRQCGRRVPVPRHGAIQAISWFCWLWWACCGKRGNSADQPTFTGRAPLSPSPIGDWGLPGNPLPRLSAHPASRPFTEPPLLDDIPRSQV